MSERDISRYLAHDFSAGTGDFADSLLERALKQLGQGDGAELPEAELEMLAAAGDSATVFRRSGYRVDSTGIHGPDEQ